MSSPGRMADNTAPDLQHYADLLDARFGEGGETRPPGGVTRGLREWFGRRLLRREWFVRRIVLDPWFLNRTLPTYVRTAWQPVENGA